MAQTRLQSLEKLVNKCNLSTQRATHGNVIRIGGRVLDGVEDAREQQFAKELEDAVADAEARCEREHQRVLMRVRRQLNDDKIKALQTQKHQLEQLAIRVSVQRDKLEAERKEEFRLEMEDQKTEALRLQWKEAERQKELAVKEACRLLTIKLNKEHRLDKEISIASSLKQARESFRKRMNEAIAQTKHQCEEAARQEANRVAQLHSNEIQRHEIRYGELKEKYYREHAHRRKVESDFSELQTDYQRFMNYTDGKYHSDYMMSLRRHGMRLSEKRPSDVSEYEEKAIKDINLSMRRIKR